MISTIEGSAIDLQAVLKMTKKSFCQCILDTVVRKVTMERYLIKDNLTDGAINSLDV